MRKILILLAAVFITALGEVSAQSFKIIVNQSNGTNSLTKKEASDFFLKKKAKWTSGIVVMPVDLASGSRTRESFSQQIHEKGTSAIRSFWQQAAFSGTASAPPEKASDDEVIDYVKKNPGAIGYVSSTANTSSVKVISVN